MSRKELERKARRLADKFYEDAQRLFDDEAMTADIAEGQVFEALQLAQSYAYDVVNNSE